MLSVMFKAFMILFAGLGLLYASPAPDSEREARFFAGVFLLESRKDLSDSLKAARFRELESMAGISTLNARARLAALREKPEEWKRLHDRMLQIITEAQAGPKTLTPKKDTPIDTVHKRR